eukprot:scaffold24855_cov64-Phaeocystis_antarctica.AAC.3
MWCCLLPAVSAIWAALAADPAVRRGPTDPKRFLSRHTLLKKLELCGDFICSAGHRLRSRLSSKPGYRDRWHPDTHLIAPNSTDLTAALLRLR